MKKIFTFIVLLSVLLTACKQQKSVADATADEVQLVGPVFNADSALAYCAAQCDFGPRTMNSKAHDDCAEWIIRKFKEFGCEVQTQKADVKGWDGTMLRSTNIIASIDVPASASDTVPDNADAAAKPHIVICAHWDSRPWADNDLDSANWKKPVMAANDGASGVGVMLELARIINEYDKKVKVSFVCFDAEDYGAPDWSGLTETEDTWALGAQHYAWNLNTLYKEGELPVAAILLDMVGGQGARFYHEGLSMHYAESLVREVWAAAAEAGFGSYFINQQGFTVTDDHKPLNEAGLPAIDIISYYPDCEQSSFGPTWHTVNDDMNHLDKDVLKAVGQTLVQYLYR